MLAFSLFYFQVFRASLLSLFWILFIALQVPDLPGLGPPVKMFPCAWELLFQGSFPPLGHKLPRSSPSFPFLCLLPLSYLNLGSLTCPPGSLGLLLLSRGCFVGVVPYLDEFFTYLGGGWWSPHLTPPPSSISHNFYLKKFFRDLKIIVDLQYINFKSTV